jgi:hypothetical protein
MEWDRNDAESVPSLCAVAFSFLVVFCPGAIVLCASQEKSHDNNCGLRDALRR